MQITRHDGTGSGYVMFSIENSRDKAIAMLAERNGIDVQASLDEMWTVFPVRGLSVELTDSEAAELDALEQFYAEKFKASQQIPAEAQAIIDSWEVRSKSPYSQSWYNSDQISWGFKPEGSLRISDHWGWADAWEEGVRHCELADEPGYVQGWRLARYENGRYHTVKVF